ncbi:hypothetical protein RUM43_000920 [Polyplax serrata]|uniref:Peptidase metallopeptidase domain-containing protein n=1 Tax=Polyplax serrata TaxID=468196 RepID=A0AAN8XT11_POLSC
MYVRRRRRQEFVWLFGVGDFTKDNLHRKIDKSSYSYLSRYGYLSPLATSETILEDEFKEGLREFQWFFGLNETGILDETTWETMRKPRCSAPDRIYGEKKRVKRYTYLQPHAMWYHPNLTYRIYNYSVKAGKESGMKKEWFDFDLRDVLDLWEEASSLTFTQSNRKSDMTFLWATYDHGDNEPFDGPGGTLAHAFGPGSHMQGHVHFDDDETWTHQSESGSNFFQVALHEVGHALGLGHSKVKDAVMFAAYKGYTTNFTMNEDDILGIQSLYGKNLGGERRRGKWYRQSTRKLNELCKVYYAMDTMFIDRKHRTFVFVGSKYWQLGTEGIEKGYPREITSKWSRAPNSMDAALNYDNMTFFFKGHKCWCYSGSKLVSGFPKYISGFFKGMPSNIDAAFVWKKKLYFFKDNLYWTYGGGSIFGKTKGKSIKRWKGVPERVSAAFQDYNKNNFIVKTHQYFRLNRRTGNVDKVKSAPYPRSFKDWWLNCPYKPQRLYQPL